VPEVVWALLAVPFAGLGPAPAVLAIGIAYGGMLAKVYSEQLESVDPRPVTALESVGAGRFQAFLFGILPQASGEMTSYTAYRFECAVRASALMGFVGAGGLGQQIESAHTDGNYAEMMSGVLVLMAFVFLIEALSDGIKRRLA
jgi:phosphonate transport system permease protein